ncbi:membrane protein insertase YidC [Donghicola sp. C2-DW-16]|uniref:Membrane protein insertase YidC n=1 Tax=Donghicola mangrovi TaxID=2729614 RepID=A0A850Q5H6_9RHOB|nr:membrane protein insertase YidC [Donghicola mangrovi]NVO21900.1 membrane protein insertase YidC [Donghicola mangrovi]NVO26510.1 membrane protein insertase YidC [Donghicola mangrovi]
MDDQNKNLLLATVLSGVVLVIWFVLFPPEEPVQDPNAPAVAEQTVGDQPAIASGDLPTADGSAAAAPELSSEADAPRIDIKTDRITGSISLMGGRVDDIQLADYHETIDPESPNVQVLSRVGSDNAYYALFGWAPVEGIDAANVPGPDTLWTAPANAVLTPETPVTLTWDNGVGQVFTRVMSIDDNFMFTMNQTVENTSAAPISVRPYGIVRRHGQPDTRKFFILHEGLIRMSDGKLEELDYKALGKMDIDEREGTNAKRIEVETNGWIGFTDHYWQTILIPDGDAPFRSTAKFFESREIYQAEAVQPAMTVAPGEKVEAGSRLFTGAKEWETLKHYEQDENVGGFVDSIDWGMFFFFTKPIFWLLHNLHALIGNMGWSIIGLTIVIKAIVLPLAYKSYSSMAKMRELQPEMEKLKEAAGDDRMKMQQGMMELYKKNKVNPASGCLPMIIQIPIFFSLYKVIFVTMELRQAPWFGWIQDLSQPDPSSILNLFGLLPFAAPGPESVFAILSLGILPILLGISMWLQQRLNPAPTDPAQAMVFAWMPWVFMFMLGNFASGLVLYWITNNTITFIQQYLIMRSHGYKPDVFGNIKKTFKRNKKAA